MLRSLLFSFALLGLTESVMAQAVDWASRPLVNFADLQTVDGAGTPTYSQGNFPIRLRGVVLNNPADMLNSAANYQPWNGGMNAGVIGGQWQVYVQADPLTAPSDRGGTAVWMGQNYGNFPWIADEGFSYTNTQWQQEIDRVSSNGALGRGMYVEVRARGGMGHNGKFNINERHDNDPLADFEIVILDSDYGMPVAQQITLADVKTAANTFVFDQTRNIGGEKYQAQWVTLNDVSLASAAGWASGGTVTVSDGLGRTFSVLLGRDMDFSTLAAPTGPLNITGIFDQEGAGMGAYRLWVMDADDIVAVPEPGSVLLAASGLALLVAYRLRQRKTRCEVAG